MRDGKSGKLRKFSKRDVFVVVAVHPVERRLQLNAGKMCAVGFFGIVEAAHRADEFAFAVVKRKYAVDCRFGRAVHRGVVDAAHDSLSGLSHQRIAGEAFARDGLGEEIAGLLADGVEFVFERRYLAGTSGFCNIS